MKTVGIAELKAKLSEHLRRVKRGERVVIEERGVKRQQGLTPLRH